MVTLSGTDAELASIDRVLRELDFQLPAGGPVKMNYGNPVHCWADQWYWLGMLQMWVKKDCPVTFSTNAEWEVTGGLCAPHYLEKTADD